MIGDDVDPGQEIIWREYCYFSRIKAMTRMRMKLCKLGTPRRPYDDYKILTSLPLPLDLLARVTTRELYISKTSTPQPHVGY